MKSLPFVIATGASAISLLLGIYLFVIGGTNQSLQNDLQKLQQEVQEKQQVLAVKQQQLQQQQEQINIANNISQQVGPALLRDMAVASIKNDKIKKILTTHGYNVELKDEAKKAEVPVKPATPVTPNP
jgi:hypothetical protein